MKKKIVALLLSLTMISGMLAGCGSDGGNESGGGNQGNQEESSNQDSANNDENTPDEGGQEDNQSGGAETSAISLPLTEDLVTLTIFMPADSNFISSDWNDSNFFQEMERRTGVHLEFQTPATGEETTAFNLMIASGELTDIVCYAYLYPEGIDAAMDDDYYLDLTPYLDTYLSNYNKARTKDAKTERETMTDSGRVGQMYFITEEEQGPWAGLQIRKDWLDDLGLDIPVTYDDWETVLTAFKEEKGAYAPLALPGNGFVYFGELSAGFDTYSDFFNQDGTVVYGPTTEGWREYLAKMNDWYTKGLINPDFMTAAEFFADTDLIASESSGAWWHMYTMPSLFEQAVPGMEITAVAAPKQNAGDTTHIRLQNQNAKQCIAISADCENKEIAMQYLDYLFTQEGMMLANYGIEGESYELVDGEVAFTDMIMNNPDGLSFMQALANYALTPEKLPSLYDWTREMVIIPEKDIASYDIWSSSGEDWVMPGALSHTAEEAIELAGIKTDIDTYFKECTSKFIIGTLDINSADWDTYVSTIEGMNIERATQIKQDALDRYFAR